MSSNRPSRLVLGVQNVWPDGQFRPRWPLGPTALVGPALAASILTASFSGPLWQTGVISEGPLPAGVAFSLVLDTLCTSTNGNPLVYTQASGTMPPGLTQSGARGEVISGTPTTSGTYLPVFQADDSTAGTSADWNARSAGALQAVRFDALATVNTYAFNEDSGKGAGWTASHITWDGLQTCDGGTGSMVFNVLNADGADNGSMVFYIDPVNHTVFTTGMDFYIQWREYMPPAFCQSVFPGAAGSIDVGLANGFKQLLLSQFYTTSGGNGGSDVTGEIVVENTRQVSCPQIYWQDSGGSDHQIETVYNGGNDFLLQNGINNPGISDPSGTLTYPLVCQKYGLTYSLEQQGVGVGVQTGTPNVNNGGFTYTPNNWQTFMLHVRPGTLGGSNTVIEFWGAKDGQTPVLIHRTAVANPGRFNNNLYNGFTLLPYCTLRTTNGGFDTTNRRNSLITHTQPIPFPGGFAVTPI